MSLFIYKVYFFLKRQQKKRIENGKSLSGVSKRLIDRIEWFYNVPLCNWYKESKTKRSGLNKKTRDEKIIISLTSYPKRIDTVWITIETLLRQTMKPDEIILWLARSQFQNIELLPKKLLEQQNRGLTIRFCDDLRSHKKYYYVMKEYPKDLIVLVDDDMFYPRNMIQRLMKMHKRYPEDICTMTAQVMEPFFETKPSLWRNPRVNEKNEHTNKVQIFTGSGSLYPPNSLDEKVFDAELIQKLCPYADDLWLTFMAEKKNTKRTSAFPWYAFPITIYGTGEGSLWYVNAEQGQNDKQWAAMIKYFKEVRYD